MNGLSEFDIAGHLKFFNTKIADSSFHSFIFVLSKKSA